MITKDIQIESETGLQSKTIAELIQKASKYCSSIWVERDEKRANAKSMLGILALEITSAAKITIIADGEDEKAALKELGEFLSL